MVGKFIYNHAELDSPDAVVQHPHEVIAMTKTHNVYSPGLNALLTVSSEPPPGDVADI